MEDTNISLLPIEYNVADDGSHAAAFETIQECREPWEVLNRIGSAERSVASAAALRALIGASGSGMPLPERHPGPDELGPIPKIVALPFDVGFGSLADIRCCIRDVRFLPDSGHLQR